MGLVGGPVLLHEEGRLRAAWDCRDEGPVLCADPGHEEKIEMSLSGFQILLIGKIVSMSLLHGQVALGRISAFFSSFKLTLEATDAGDAALGHALLHFVREK